MKRKESSKVQFRTRIPNDVLDKARGQTVSLPVGDSWVPVTISRTAVEVKLSLRTTDKTEGAIRHAKVSAKLKEFWRALKNGPQPLTHKQVVALSGELYRAFVDTFENNPGPTERWERVQETDASAARGEYGPWNVDLMIPGESRNSHSLGYRFGGLADAMLAKHGLVTDDASRKALIMQAAKAMSEAAERIKGFTVGDYSPDQVRPRFPEWEDTPKPQPAKSAARPAVSLSGLLEDWRKQQENKPRGAAASTRDAYARAVRYFVEFLGHDDAARVTPEDVNSFKKHRLTAINPKTGKPASSKTVKDGDLAALKTIFKWGVEDLKLKSNPASDITTKVWQRIVNRPQYFREDERRAILELARGYEPEGREGAKLSRAKRWVPWLCAYTGARSGEMVQLRKKDVRKEEGFWIIHITPEAGTVKDKKAREVPIHEHLIDIGFLDTVEAAAPGYLFIDVAEGQSPLGKIQALKNKLSAFVRTVMDDPEIAPLHGWRHTFKTVAREVGDINETVLDAIVGHKPAGVGAKYGAATVKARAMAMQKFPRYI